MIGWCLKMKLDKILENLAIKLLGEPDTFVERMVNCGLTLTKNRIYKVAKQSSTNGYISVKNDDGYVSNYPIRHFRKAAK